MGASAGGPGFMYQRPKVNPHVTSGINLPSRRSDTASVGKGGGAVCGLAAKLPCSANCGGGFLAVGGDSFIGTSLKSLLRPGRGGCL